MSTRSKRSAEAASWRTGLSRAEARALLMETDRKRKEFIRKVFKVEPNAPENFDLVLNSDRMKSEDMLEMATLAR